LHNLWVYTTNHFCATLYYSILFIHDTDKQHMKNTEFEDHLLAFQFKILYHPLCCIKTW